MDKHQLHQETSQKRETWALLHSHVLLLGLSWAKLKRETGNHPQMSPPPMKRTVRARCHTRLVADKGGTYNVTKGLVNMARLLCHFFTQFLPFQQSQ